MHSFTFRHLIISITVSRCKVFSPFVVTRISLVETEILTLPSKQFFASLLPLGRTKGEDQIFGATAEGRWVAVEILVRSITT